MPTAVVSSWKRRATTARVARRLAARPYVMLTVTDTGCGIAHEHLDRVFDPFFTTKDAGKGSGLGLSMAYGFVKQSGGHIRIESEIGVGTSVSIYLPRSEAPAAARLAPASPDAAELPSSRNGETILVVEDNDDVRAFATSALERLGYGVLQGAVRRRRAAPPRSAPASPRRCAVLGRRTAGGDERPRACADGAHAIRRAARRVRLRLYAERRPAKRWPRPRAVPAGEAVYARGARARDPAGDRLHPRAAATSFSAAPCCRDPRTSFW